MPGTNAHPILDWSEVPYFLALARAKTLSAAGRLINVDRTTIARNIDQIEGRIGTALFFRQDGQHILTELGRSLFASAERAETELGLPTMTGHAKGKVRLSLPSQFSVQITSILTKFVELNPDILLEISASDRLTSLHRYEADVAIRISQTNPRNLHADDLGKMSFGLYKSRTDDPASNLYLTHPGQDEVPESVSALLPNAEIAMSIDGHAMIQDFIAQGVGSGILPDHIGANDDRLDRIGQIATGAPYHVWLVSLPEQRHHPRVAALTKHLRKGLKAMLN